eukprot:3416933-Pleurochrysis_carterae.AAC.1
MNRSICKYTRKRASICIIATLSGPTQQCICISFAHPQRAQHDSSTPDLEECECEEMRAR